MKNFNGVSPAVIVSGSINANKFLEKLKDLNLEKIVESKLYFSYIKVFSLIHSCEKEDMIVSELSAETNTFSKYVLSTKINDVLRTFWNSIFTASVIQKEITPDEFFNDIELNYLEGVLFKYLKNQKKLLIQEKQAKYCIHVITPKKEVKVLFFSSDELSDEFIEKELIKVVYPDYQCKTNIQTFLNMRGINYSELSIKIAPVNPMMVKILENPVTRKSYMNTVNPEADAYYLFFFQ